MGILLLAAVVGLCQGSPADVRWDVVVLGRIDFCLVCQFGPPPHVRYTRVLAGPLPRGQAEEQLTIVGIDNRLLRAGGVPIYRSEQDEIVFLKKVDVSGYADAESYTVVEIEDATPENLRRLSWSGMADCR